MTPPQLTSTAHTVAVVVVVVVAAATSSSSSSVQLAGAPCNSRSSPVRQQTSINYHSAVTLIVVLLNLFTVVEGHKYFLHVRQLLNYCPLNNDEQYYCGPPHSNIW